MKRYFNEFYHWFANFKKLERRKPQLYPCYYQLAYKKYILQANQSQNQYF